MVLNISIEKDGTYSMSTNTPNLGQLQSETSHGTWEFDNDQSSITLLEEGSILGVSYDIVQLKNHNLKLRQTDFNNAVYDWSYISK